MGAAGEAAALEPVEVAAGGHRRDAELLLELGDGHRPRHAEALDDRRAARVSQEPARF
jgi:hypothetical protein